MILDFGRFTRRGLLADLQHPAEIWGGGDISQTERVGGKAGEEMVEDRQTTGPACDERVRDPKNQPPHGRYQ